jgi:hypothetical protein
VNDQTNNKLDELLRAWAAAEQPGQTHLESLCERAFQAAGLLKEAGGEPVGMAHKGLAGRGHPRPTRSATWPSRLGWFVLGLAAAILAVALLVSRLGPDQVQDVTPPQPLDFPSAARLDQRQLLLQATSFAAIGEVFADQLAWMAETNGKVLLGVEPEAEALAAGPEAISVRLVVMARRRGQLDWQPHLNVDCITYGEQVVELPVEAGSEDRLALWTYLLPDGMIAVDTTLGIEGAGGEGLSSSTVLRPQVPQQILDLEIDQTEYRVFQTAAVLPKEMG